MAKKTYPLKTFGTPPLLDEKLIAQLQGAVHAAQRKRLLENNDSPKQIAEQVRDQYSDRGYIGRDDEHAAITCDSMVRNDTFKP
jgi:hypothetical protein